MGLGDNFWNNGVKVSIRIFGSVQRRLRLNDRFRNFWLRREEAVGVQVRRPRLQAGRDRVAGGVEVLEVAKKKDYV